MSAAWPRDRQHPNASPQSVHSAKADDTPRDHLASVEQKSKTPHSGRTPGGITQRPPRDSNPGILDYSANRIAAKLPAVTWNRMAPPRTRLARNPGRARVDLFEKGGAVYRPEHMGG